MLLCLFLLAQQGALDLITPDRFDLSYGFGDQDFAGGCGVVDGDASFLEFGLSWDLAPRQAGLSREDIFWALQEDRRAGDPPPSVLETPTPPAEEEHSCAGTSAAVGGLSGLAGMALVRFGPMALMALGSLVRRRQPE